MPRGAKAEVKEEFRWAAPPEHPFIKSKYQGYIDKVRESPGRWAQIITAPHAPYSQLNSVKKGFGGDEAFETKIVRLSDDEFGLFLRYRTAEQMKAANGK